MKKPDASHLEAGQSGPEEENELQDKSRMSKCDRCLKWFSREFHPYKIFPMTKWIQDYERSFIARDLVAGLTIGLLMVPLCFANSELAGLDPYLGLYSSFIGISVYTILGIVSLLLKVEFFSRVFKT